MGSGFIMRLARIVWSLVSGQIVFAAGRDRILRPVEPRFDLDVFVALVTGRDISGCRVADDPFDLGHIGLGCISPTD